MHRRSGRLGGHRGPPCESRPIDSAAAAQERVHFANADRAHVQRSGSAGQQLGDVFCTGLAAQPSQDRIGVQGPALITFRQGVAPAAAPPEARRSGSPRPGTIRGAPARVGRQALQHNASSAHPLHGKAISKAECRLFAGAGRQNPAALGRQNRCRHGESYLVLVGKNCGKTTETACQSCMACGASDACGRTAHQRGRRGGGPPRVLHAGRLGAGVQHWEAGG